MSYWRNLLIAFDQLVNAIFAGSCDETLSARAHREKWWVENLINLLFWDRNHCRDSYIAERNRHHLPREYWTLG